MTSPTRFERRPPCVRRPQDRPTFRGRSAAGLDPAASVGRPVITEPFADKITEWIDRSSGRVRADVVHQKLAAMGFVGSERTTRRVVAQLKSDYVRANHRIYKPWITEPGLWLQFDYGSGPIVGGQATTLFCAWLAWSRFRVIVALADRTFPSLVSALDTTLRAIGGAPTYLLTDNEKTVTTSHVAGLAVRNRELLGVAHYYGVAIHTCVVADPESKGGTEATVRIAKADVLPRPDNLVGEYRDFASFERACGAASERFNTRVHRETGERPVDRLALEQAQLHRLPPEPYTVAFGETRTVSWSSLISFQGARYSVPHQLCAEVVFVRQMGDEVVIVATGVDGAKEVARHPVAAKGQMTLHDGHYPPRRKNPERAPKANNPTESEFLALGEGPGVTSLKRPLRVPLRSTSACVKPLPSGAWSMPVSSTRHSGWPHWPVDSNKATSAPSRPSAASPCDGSQRITPFSPAPLRGPASARPSSEQHRDDLRRGGHLVAAAPSALSARGSRRRHGHSQGPALGTGGTDPGPARSRG